MDKTLTDSLPPRPSFIYSKAPNFGAKVIKRVLDVPIKPSIFGIVQDFIPAGGVVHVYK